MPMIYQIRALWLENTWRFWIHNSKLAKYVCFWNSGTKRFMVLGRNQKISDELWIMNSMWKYVHSVQIPYSFTSLGFSVWLHFKFDRDLNFHALHAYYEWNSLIHFLEHGEEVLSSCVHTETCFKLWSPHTKHTNCFFLLTLEQLQQKANTGIFKPSTYSCLLCHAICSLILRKLNSQDNNKAKI